MSHRRLITPTLLGLILAVCQNSARADAPAPKDTPPPPAPAAPAKTGKSNNLPAGHPTVGSAAGSATLPDTINGTAIPTAEGADLKWTAPAAWEPKTGSALRKGSYRMKVAGGEVDIAITAFPGATGGLEANLNRWRGQVGLASLPPAEVMAASEKLEANGLTFTVVDYQGHAGHLLGAIASYGGNSWFFKLTGPTAAVVAAKPGFRDFLRTVKAP